MNDKPSDPKPLPPSMNRQAFLRTAAGGVGVCYAMVAGYPIYRYLQSPIEKGAGAPPVNELKLEGVKVASGAAHMFKFGPLPAMLIHHKDDSWTALTAKCSHLGCTVKYDGDKDKIVCACHGGVYDAHSGANISGPPPKPLEKLEVKITENGVLVSRAKKTT